jgi:hypothetical protein
MVNPTAEVAEGEEHPIRLYGWSRHVYLGRVPEIVPNQSPQVDLEIRPDLFPCPFLCHDRSASPHGRLCRTRAQSGSPERYLLARIVHGCMTQPVVLQEVDAWRGECVFRAVAVFSDVDLQTAEHLVGKKAKGGNPA